MLSIKESFGSVERAYLATDFIFCYYFYAIKSWRRSSGV